MKACAYSLQADPALYLCNGSMFSMASPKHVQAFLSGDLTTSHQQEISRRCCHFFYSKLEGPSEDIQHYSYISFVLWLDIDSHKLRCSLQALLSGVIQSHQYLLSRELKVSAAADAWSLHLYTAPGNPV